MTQKGATNIHFSCQSVKVLFNLLLSRIVIITITDYKDLENKMIYLSLSLVKGYKNVSDVN